MDKKTAVFLTSLVTLMLTGCFENKPLEETKSVDFYSKNPAERAVMVKKCSNNPGELKDTPNCINAKQAARVATSGTLRVF